MILSFVFLLHKFFKLTKLSNLKQSKEVVKVFIRILFIVNFFKHENTQLTLTLIIEPELLSV